MLYILNENTKKDLGSSMRKKFKIYYPEGYPDPDKAGKRYKTDNGFVTMSQDGVFFLVSTDGWYTYCQKLSRVLEKYDVVWRD